MSKRTAIILAVALGCAAVWWWTRSADDSCPAQFADGRPPAVAGWRDRSARTLCFSQFAVRFSAATKTPLWSAEHLTGARVRAAEGLPRTGRFHDEPRLPAAWRSDLADYRRSGYDRGHMSPSGDMPSSPTQDESFSLANMIPQHPCSNEGIWASIESAVREMALRQDDLYVVTGPVFLHPGREHTIGRGVAVPDEVFKAVYDPVTGEAGAYLAENADGPEWKSVPLDRLKELTGIDAFPSLPADAKSAGMKLPAPEKSHYRCRLHSSGEVPQ